MILVVCYQREKVEDLCMKEGGEKLCERGLKFQHICLLLSQFQLTGEKVLFVVQQAFLKGFYKKRRRKKQEGNPLTKSPLCSNQEDEKKKGSGKKRRLIAKYRKTYRKTFSSDIKKRDLLDGFTSVKAAASKKKEESIFFWDSLLSLGGSHSIVSSHFTGHQKPPAKPEKGGKGRSFKHRRETEGGDAIKKIS